MRWLVDRAGLSRGGAVAGGAVTAVAMVLSVAICGEALLARSFAPDATTAAQWVYFFHIFAWAPALGVFLFWSQAGGFLARLARGCGVIAAEAVGLMGAGVGALIAYPWYPRQGPHEIVATLTSFPAVVAPAIVAAAVSVRGRRGRTAALTAAFLAGGTALVYLGTVSEMDACLPVSPEPHDRIDREDLDAGPTDEAVAGAFSREEAARFATCVGLAPARDPSPLAETLPFWRAAEPALRWGSERRDAMFPDRSCRWTAEWFEGGWFQARRVCGAR